MGIGVAGLEPDRLAIFGAGLVELPLASRAAPRLLWAPTLSGWRPDRLAEHCDGLVEHPDDQGVAKIVVGHLGLGHQGASEVAQAIGEVGLDPDRLAVFGDGFLQLPLME